MDDIICPECGRPNLIEAKKCWYCQTDLSSIKETMADNEPPVQEEPTPTQAQPEMDTPAEEDEEIPEWLTKIRKKIEEERGPEEELPYWKQKDIFGGDKKIAAKSSKVKHTPKTRANNPKQEDSSERKTNTTKPENSFENIGLDDLSNDLPDGFTEL